MNIYIVLLVAIVGFGLTFVPKLSELGRAMMWLGIAATLFLITRTGTVHLG